MDPMQPNENEAPGIGSRKNPSVVTWCVRATWVGIIAGFLAALSDGVTIEIWTTSDPLRVVAYAAANNILCTGLLGALVAIALVWPRKLLRRAFLADWPLAVAVSAGLSFLARDVFDGDWVRTQSWAPIARWLLPLLHLFAVLTVIASTRRVLAARLCLRRIVAVIALGGAILTPLLAMRWLGAYPSLLAEAAIGSMVFMSLAVLLATRGDMAIWKTTLLAAVALGAAFAFLHHERGHRTVHTVRSEIVSRPLFISRTAMMAAEWYLLDRIRPLERGFAGALTPEERAALLDAIASPRRPMPRGDAAAKNVVWIALDTLRADHVGCLGYDRATTPNVDAFAKEAWVYERATTPCPTSLHAYSSALNGVAPRNAPAYLADLADAPKVPVGFSMPEILRRNGFTTVAVTAFSKGFQSSRGFKTFRRGFDRFLVARDKGFRADEVVDRGLEILEVLARRDAPFFAWFHFMDIHAPYEFHAEFPFGDLPIDAYDSEIAFDDAQVGRLLKGLDTLGLSRDTVVILFSDHGEAFGEHNIRHHGASLHQHQIHVPLMIREPGGKHGTVANWVSLCDLAPTTLSCVGIADGYHRFGRDIRPAAFEESSGIDARYAEIPVKGKDTSRERCVVSGDLKLIWKPLAGTYQVFDLVQDPKESRNILDFDSARQERLMALLQAFDDRIASFWKQPGEAAPSPSTASGASHVMELVSKLEASSTDEERLRAIADLGRLLSSSASKWWDHESRGLLGASAVDRLRVALRQIIAAKHTPVRVFDRACWLLTYFDTPRTARFLAQHAQRIRSGGVALDVAKLRARHGDKDVKAFLSDRLGKVHAAARIGVAAALAHLGDGRGRDLLRMALYSPSLRTVREATLALGALGDPSCLDAALFSDSKLWRDETLLRVLLPAALADTTSRGHAALLMLANTAGLDTARAARGALNLRFRGRNNGELSRVWESIYGAKNAIQYGDDHLAIRYFRAVTPGHDVVVGPFLWLLVRACWQENDRRGAEAALARLRANIPVGSTMARLAERLASVDFGRTQPCPRPENVSLEVRVIDEGARLRPGELGFSVVEILNSGDRLLPGGAGPRLPWFEWIHLDENGKPQRGAFAVRLPPEGLAPGRSTRLVIPIRRPKTPGQYRPTLLFGTRTNRKTARQILMRPTVTLAE